MKRKLSELSAKDRVQTLDALYTAASTLKNRGEMKAFLRDLLTESERVMLGRRILIARMLIEGMSYIDIAEELHVGYDTIGRVERWLKDHTSGYETAITELNVIYKLRNKKRLWEELYKDTTSSGTIARLKKKFPLHFLLFPMPKKYKNL